MPSSPLESRLRYEFRNAELLRQALTHRSHSSTHNERLEFLGDSVLNCAVAALLFQRFGKLDEGDLSRVRANLVKQQSLYEIAQALNISEGLRLGEGELRSGGFRRPSILADTLEAVLGAVFLDGGFDAAQTVIKRLYVPILDHIDPRTLGKDAKTLLQEYLQGHKIALPTSAKKALDEVMAAAPAVVSKSKRSKGARAAKKAEAEIVPGVTGVQAALDLRSPDRKNERAAARGEMRTAPAAEPIPERTAIAVAAVAAPLAVIRAAHVEYSAPEKSERTDRVERGEKADKADKLDKPAAEAKMAEARPAEVRPTDPKPAEPAARTTDKPHRTRDAAASAAASAATNAAASSASPATNAAAPTEHEPGVADSVQTRVADAGH
ncbi:MAG: ribonuclease III [Burkholderia sp.]|nr:ribonuclease III [Burkholderia sp.]